MKERVLKKIAVSLLAAFLAFGTGITAYADSYYDLYDIREGTISLELPEGWFVEEVDADVNSDLPYEKIAESFDDLGKTALHMDLYFMMDEVADSEYFYITAAEDTAMLYYEEYGMNAIETLYGQIGGVTDVAVGDAVFYDGEWNGFLVVPVTGTVVSDDGVTEAFADIVYLTCEMPDSENVVVHNLLMFYNDDNTPITGNAVTVVKRIADGFYDYGYDNTMAGVSSDFGDYEWGADGEGIDFDLVISIVTMLISSGVAVAVAVMKRRNKKSTQKEQFIGWKRPERDKAEHDHVQQILTRNSRSAGRGENRSQDAEERYLQSLETLRKSGLLTREEMQDMIDRHKRSIFREDN